MCDIIRLISYYLIILLLSPLIIILWIIKLLLICNKHYETFIYNNAKI